MTLDAMWVGATATVGRISLDKNHHDGFGASDIKSLFFLQIWVLTVHRGRHFLTGGVPKRLGIWIFQSKITTVTQ